MIEACTDLNLLQHSASFGVQEMKCVARNSCDNVVRTKRKQLVAFPIFSLLFTF